MIYDMYRMAEAYVETGAAFDVDCELNEQQKFLSLLGERHDAGTLVFVLFLDSEENIQLEQHELEADDYWRLPFEGGKRQKLPLAPVFKISKNSRGGISPTESIRRRTITQFQTFAEEDGPDPKYFAKVAEILQAPEITFSGNTISSRAGGNALDLAIGILAKAFSASKPTPILTVGIDEEGMKWPGNDERFVKWFLETELRLERYMTRGIPDSEGICPLSGRRARLFANALSGAGLNFGNTDFRGSFSELRDERGLGRCGLSANAADLLYIYKNHVAPTFLDIIAGSKALVIPSANLDSPQQKQDFHDRIQKLVRSNGVNPGSERY